MAEVRGSCVVTNPYLRTWHRYVLAVARILSWYIMPLTTWTCASVISTVATFCWTMACSPCVTAYCRGQARGRDGTARE